MNTERGQTQRAFIKLAIKNNNTSGTERCSVCREWYHVDIGPFFTQGDSWTFVCDECARKVDEVLFDVLETWRTHGALTPLGETRLPKALGGGAIAPTIALDTLVDKDPTIIDEDSNPFYPPEWFAVQHDDLDPDIWGEVLA